MYFERFSEENVCVCVRVCVCVLLHLHDFLYNRSVFEVSLCLNCLIGVPKVDYHGKSSNKRLKVKMTCVYTISESYFFDNDVTCLWITVNEWKCCPLWICLWTPCFSFLDLKKNQTNYVRAVMWKCLQLMAIAEYVFLTFSVLC